MKKTRQQVIKSLVNLSEPLPEIHRMLSLFPWDCGKPLVILTREDASSILTRYLSGELPGAELEHWANLVEGREDIEIDQKDRDVIRGLIFELANPELTAPLTPDLAWRWLDALGS